MDPQHSLIVNSFHSFLGQSEFPCVAAKDALAKGDLKIMVAEHMACPVNDRDILNFLYDFIGAFRNKEKGFHSAAIIFKQPGKMDEAMFDQFMWQRLQALRNMDAANYAYDSRVDDDPASPAFSFSLMEEAFFVLGLHPGSSRAARQFEYPALVFNPHAQFEKMKRTASYDKMKVIVRKRDIDYSGSVNPMLTDFGKTSEVFQYSGRKYDSSWRCPLNNNNT